MSTSFADLRKSSKSMYDKIVQETNKMQNTGRQSDDRFWQPEIDKAGNGSAIIRFLPPTAGEDLPYVRLFSHGFQGPGGWYIENSLTTLGEQDPCSEYNTKLWNRGDDLGKELARKQKRRLNYISNIYVVRDPANPEREGQTYLYKYGKKIFDKLNDMMHPEFDDEEPVNPYDLWEGANFRMKIRQVEGYRNYDKSDFDKPSALLDDDDELEKIWKAQFSLMDFLDAKNFKSYTELQAKLTRVLGLDGSSPSPAEEPESSGPEQASPSENFKKVIDSTGSSEDADMEFFKSLAEDEA